MNNTMKEMSVAEMEAVYGGISAEEILGGLGRILDEIIGASRSLIGGLRGLVDFVRGIFI